MGRLVAALLALLIAACGAPASTKYVQTWTASYGATTCAQWFDEMTAQQRWVAAADMLLSAQRRDKPEAGIPPDEDVDAFEVEMTAACQTQGMAISDVAAVVYVGFRERFAP